MTENIHYPQETVVTLEEAVDFLNFFARKHPIGDIYSDHYEARRFRYLSTTEIITQDKPFNIEESSFRYNRIIGNDIFLATLDGSDLTLYHHPGLVRLGKGEERFDSKKRPWLESKSDKDSEYLKESYIWGDMQFWPFYHKFGLPNNFGTFGYPNLDDLDDLDIDFTDPKLAARRFKCIINDRSPTPNESVHLSVNRNELLEYLTEQFGDLSFGERIPIIDYSPEETILTIDKISKREGKHLELFPLAPTLFYNKSYKHGLDLLVPRRDDLLYLQYDIEKGLERALIEEEARPKRVGNGVVVMCEANIPKYLTRKLRL